MATNARDARYGTPSPIFPETQVSLDKLWSSWEKLRDLDENGYQTSRSRPMSTWLVGVDWRGGSTSGPSRGKGTTCSPATTQAMVMALSEGSGPRYAPKHSDGQGVSMLYCTLANGNFRTSNAGHMRMARALGITDITNADNGWARANIFFNFAYEIEPKDMRKGDIVGISWMNGGGHATFCWDVHLNGRGEVDAFQYVSSNGSLRPSPEEAAAGMVGIGGGRGAGVSVSGWYNPNLFGRGKFIERTSEGTATTPPTYKKNKNPYFGDDEKFVEFGAWCTWDQTLRSARQLTGMRKPARGGLEHCRRVWVARLHGARPPEPYAMGGTPAPAPTHTAEVAPTQVNQAVIDQNPAQVRDQAKPVAQIADRPTSGQLALEQKLKMLFDVGHLEKDPGQPDAVLDEQTKATIKEFQGKHGLRATGTPDARTALKVRQVYAQQLATEAGRRWTRGEVVRPAGGQGAGQAAGGGGAAPAQAAPAQAAPAQAGPAQAGPAQAGGAGGPQLTALYWRHGAAAPGSIVRVTLLASGADGRSFPLKLKANGETKDTGLRLTVANGRAFADVTLPRPVQQAGQNVRLAAPQPIDYVAVAEGLGESPVALTVG